MYKFPPPKKNDLEWSNLDFLGREFKPGVMMLSKSTYPSVIAKLLGQDTSKSKRNQ